MPQISTWLRCPFLVAPGPFPLQHQETAVLLMGGYVKIMSLSVFLKLKIMPLLKSDNCILYTSVGKGDRGSLAAF